MSETSEYNVVSIPMRTAPRDVTDIFIGIAVFAAIVIVFTVMVGPSVLVLVVLWEILDHQAVFCWVYTDQYPSASASSRVTRS